MVRLTVETIDDAPQYINTLRDRELNLRGFKIPAIENMGVTRDQFDVIDLTDNDIKKIDNFPLLKRLNTLYLHNNRVQLIQNDVGAQLPNLKTLALTNNNICELGDIDPLASCKKLEYLTLIGNPICHKANYRHYLIFKLPSVRVIDFKRIRLAEREAAKTMFKGSKGKKNRENIGRSYQTAMETDEKENEAQPKHRSATLSDQDRSKIQEAIAAASSLQEIEYLQSILSSGRIPDKGWNKMMDLIGDNTAATEGFVPENEGETVVEAMES